ncbi:MAG: methyl-accepting chemotaxis protein [Treponema sp.]|nr:methyl-accepting chemotaxis protein [Treponema sp.]
MVWNKVNKESAQAPSIGALLTTSRRMLEDSKSRGLSIVKPTSTELSPEVKEIFENISEAISNYQESVNYTIMKYQLANKALHTALWDMEVVAGDPVNPNNTFIWSEDFRRMLGFSNEIDFPNKLNSWSDRLHPEDKEMAVGAFARHMLDFSGRTPFDIKYRLKLKNGTYGFFRATGDTIRDETGKPLRVAGLLLDLAEEKKIEELDKKLMEKLKQDTEFVGNITKLVNDFDSSIDFQTKAVEESSQKTEHMLNSLKHVSEISRREQESIRSLLENATRAQTSMRGTRQSVQSISQLVEGISSAIQIISSIAANTNLLSMNAAIEAAHAGDAGRGFAVVADEIRRLSESTRINSVDISKTLKNIIEGITITSKQSDETDKCIIEISQEINVFAQVITDIINTFSKLSEESHEIAVVFNNLKEQTATFKTGYSHMVSINKQLVSTMNDIAARRAS